MIVTNEGRTSLFFSLRIRASFGISRLPIAPIMSPDGSDVGMSLRECTAKSKFLSKMPSSNSFVNNPLSPIEKVGMQHSTGHQRS